MDEPDPALGTGCRQPARGLSVDAAGPFSLVLRTIDGGVGRTGQDHLRTQAVQRTGNGLGPFEVQQVPAAGEKLLVPRHRMAGKGQQPAAQLTCGARDHHPHDTKKVGATDA